MLWLGACGLDEQAQQVADGMTTALSQGDDDEAARDLAQCTAERWVGETGVDRLREDGLVTGEQDVVADNVRATSEGRRPVSQETARDYALARVSCLDLDAQALATRDEFPGATARQRDDYADCLKEIDTDLMEDALTQRTLGNADAPAVGRLERQVQRCRETLR